MQALRWIALLALAVCFAPGIKVDCFGQEDLGALLDQTDQGAGQSATASAARRLAIPAAAAARESLADIKDIFRDDYAGATTTERRQGLARQLLAQAGKTPAGVDRYMLLSESMRLAADAGDVEMTFNAIAQCAEQFAVDADSLKLDALGKFAVKASPQSLDGLARMSLALAKQAVESGKSQVAQKSLAFAAGFAKKAKNRSLIAEVTKFQQAARDSERDSKEIEAITAKLEASPNDSEVCLEAGKYFCFRANDWERGLPLLAKGSDTDLSRLAVAELNCARTPDAVTTVGDSWWDWAQKEKGSQKTAAALHAVGLYESIINATQGLERARLEKRIAQIPKDQSPRGRRVALAELKELSATNIQGGMSRDGTFQGNPYTCRGQTWPTGIVAHPWSANGGVSSIVYAVPQGAKRLIGKAGVFSPANATDQSQQPESPQVFEILVDGQTAWKSPPLRKRDETADFDVVLSGATEVELRTTSKTVMCAWSAWLNPEIVY
jgi:hypothetical protein